MNDRVPKERQGTSQLNDVFLKIYPYNPKISEIPKWFKFNIHAKYNKNLLSIFFVN